MRLRLEVVDDPDVVACREQLVDDVGADQPCSSGYESRHELAWATEIPATASETTLATYRTCSSVSSGNMGSESTVRARLSAAGTLALDRRRQRGLAMERNGVVDAA